MAKHVGKCALCGRVTTLTFEHIPPEAAYNKSPVKSVQGTILLSNQERLPWETKDLRYENQQRGLGMYSLCNECNNNTGSWYGSAFNEFAWVSNSAMKNLSREDNESICIKELRPNQIIKQVLSMFCSTLPREDEIFDDLRIFVLNRDSVGIDREKYKICMYFTDSTLMKYTGLTVIYKMSESYDSFEFQYLSEITAYPFGFLLYYKPKPNWDFKGTDITDFAFCKYDDVATITMPWIVFEVNDMFPEDYRSKEEILECIEKNKTHKEK